MKPAPVPEAYEHLPQWAFGESKDLADALCSLVLSGKKTALVTALYTYELDDLALPEAGNRSVILDGSGHARCVIECTSAEAVPFDEVDAAFAAAEGEGDLKHWQKTHKKLFESQGYFSPDMLLVCEHFRVIEKLTGGAQ